MPVRRRICSLVLALLALCSPLIPPSAAVADEADYITRTLFAPETFTRSHGTSHSRTFDAPSSQGTFNLHVVNGDGAGHNRVSSGTIKVNGVTIVNSSQLNQQVNFLDRALTNVVKGSNTLNVSIASNSSSSSYLTVSITGKYLLDIRITSPADGTWEPLDHVTVLGTYQSYTTLFTIDVNGVSAAASSGSFSAANVPLSGGSNPVTATIATGDTLTDTHTITLTLNRPPVAEAGTNRNVTVGDTVVLDGRNSADPEGALITYLWAFATRPQGSAAALVNPTSVNPSFVPDLPGDYVVSLVVNDGVQDGLADSVTVSAAPPNVAPTANAGPDQSVATGSPVQLDGRGSFDPEGAPLLYSWSFLARPPGSGAELNADNSAMPSFTADVDGSYTVELTVSDGLLTGLPDDVFVVAATPNAPPVANAGIDMTVYRNTAVYLDGTQSYDPDNNALTFLWSPVSKPEGSTSELDNAASPTPSFVADREGEYVERLVVNDGQLDSAPDTVVVTSVNAAPVAAAGPDQSVIIGAAVSLDGSGSTDANGDPLGYSWTFISTPTGSAAALSGESTAHPTFVPDLAGEYVIRLIVSDGWVTSVPDDVPVTAWPPILPVPSVLGMTQSQAQSTLVSSGLAVGAVTAGYSDTVAAGRVMSQNPGYGSTANHLYPVDFVVSAGPVPLPIPPDPATVAPPVSPTVATTVASSTGFLHAGPDPIQRDVPPGTIEEKRAAVLRGKVTARDDAPLPGVSVTVLNHPEFGRTVTRTDGIFDMAVNGGGPLTFVYRKAGFLSAQRRIHVSWQEYGRLPDVVLVPIDNQVTTVDLASPVPIQVARGSAVTDPDGTRQATLLVPQGTTAQMLLPDGSTRSFSALHVRATEYTVGGNGPKAMPAQLPPTTGYTYAVSLTVDEAVSAGAASVRFDRALPYYVENFLGFPVGMAVPAGYYDQVLGTWVPSSNGRVVRILGDTGGLADVDVDGSGAPAGAAALSSLGITDAERESLAALYIPGASLWRVPIPHFTDWDFNCGIFCTGDCRDPRQPGSTTDNNTPYECKTPGSVIGCRNQTLGETFPVTGTPFSLHYASDRALGRQSAYVVKTPLSGDTVPQGLQRIDLRISVAGRTFTRSYPAAPNQDNTFVWDGKDAYGRTVQGKQKAKIAIGYVYEGYYELPSALDPSFGQSGSGPIPGVPPRIDAVLWQGNEVTLGTWDARGQGLGGWTLGIHHAYDPVGQTLYLGDGGRRDARDISKIVTTVAGTGNEGYAGYPPVDGPAKEIPLALPGALVVAPDGSYYFVETWLSVVRRVTPDGGMTTVAGTGTPGYSGDGGPAVQARLNTPFGLALGMDNSLYVADSYNNRVRRVWPDGTITTVAGTGDPGPGGGYNPPPSDEGALATQAHLYTPTALAIDGSGDLYIADSGHDRVRKIGTDNRITTVAGGGTSYADGIPATQAVLSHSYGLALGPDGSFYIGETFQNRVRRVLPTGIITTVAGNGDWGYSGDGGPATDATLNDPFGVAVGQDGSLYIADTYNYCVRRVGPEGTITTVAGTGVMGYGGDGGPALSARLKFPMGVALGEDGALYVSDSYNYRVRRVTPSLPGYDGSDIAIASEDGKEIHRFDRLGKHLETSNSLTGAVLHSFDYDASGYLTRVVDSDNNATTVERDSNGKPTGVAAPGGQRTALSLDPYGYGYLAHIANPAGDNVQLHYKHEQGPSSGMGLLSLLVDPRGYPHGFEYEGDTGRLVRDDDPAGGFKTLARAAGEGGGIVVSVGTALGRVATYGENPLSTGAVDLFDTTPTGARTATRIDAAGTSTTTWSPDNTVTEVATGPDPRFGMQAPILVHSTVWLPGGGVFETMAERTAVLLNPDNPYSLLSQTDIAMVNGRTYATVFDNATLTTTMTTPTGRRTVGRIDGKGRLVSLQADNAAMTATLPMSLSYDSNGRLSRAGQGNDLWTYLYDEKNRLWRKIDPMDNVVEFGYDNADRVNMVKLPSGRTYGFAYDGAGNRTRVIMPNGAEHLLGYTPVDLDNSYVPPGNPSYAHAYSLDRDWTRTTLPSGKGIDAEYEASGGRLLSVAYPEGLVTYGYADNTRRVSELARQGADNVIQRMDFGYDGFLRTRVASAGTAIGEVRYVYDNNFWLRGIALDNAWAPLNRDDDGFLTQHGPFTFGRGGPAGTPDNVSDLGPALCWPDGPGTPAPCVGGNLAFSYGYDNTGRLARRTLTVGGMGRHEVLLFRDAAGRIFRKLETVGSVTSTFDYAYDLDGQLFEVRRDGALVEQYGYDNNANRNVVVTQSPPRNLLTGDFEYDVQDRLGRMGSVNYTFDADGYLTQRGSDTLVYSARGELLSATVSGQVISYAYDGTGRRVARTSTAGTTQYLYGDLENRFRITASRNPDNVLTVYYYDDFGALYALERGGARYYVGSDHLGTPKVVTDNTGNAIKIWEYDGWGVRTTILDNDSTLDLPVGFAGGIPDDAMGLVRFGFRDYEPGTGRWTAKDPIFFRGGQFNLYAYVNNDPTNNIDPDGRCNLYAMAFIAGVYAVYQAFDAGRETYNIMVLNNMIDSQLEWTDRMINSIDINERNGAQKLDNLIKYQRQLGIYQAELNARGVAGLYKQLFKQVLQMPIPR